MKKLIASKEEYVKCLLLLGRMQLLSLAALVVAAASAPISRQKVTIALALLLAPSGALVLMMC